jgi:hypothetical protein
VSRAVSTLIEEVNTEKNDEDQLSVLDLLRYGAEDFLYAKYGIEVEALHYFVDKNEASDLQFDRMLTRDDSINGAASLLKVPTILKNESRSLSPSKDSA